MSDHTPSLDQVRGRYCDGTLVQTGHVTDGHEFDRMIAKVCAEAKAEALREAADSMPVGWGAMVWIDRETGKVAEGIPATWLRARADKLDTL